MSTHILVVDDSPADLRVVERLLKKAFSDEINLERIGGRGLLLIRSFMDEAVHNSRGNELTMIKRAVFPVTESQQDSSL